MTLTLDLGGLIAFGIGFWLLMDGMIFGVMPEIMRRLLQQVSAQSDEELRHAGLICAMIGAGIVFLIVRFPAAG